MPTMLVVSHAVAGTAAALAGALTAILRKGGGVHRVLGTVYVGAVVVLTLSGVPLYPYQPNPAVAGLMLLASYLGVTGWMAASLRRSPWRRWAWIALLSACIGLSLTFSWYAMAHQMVRPAIGLAILSLGGAAFDARRLMRSEEAFSRASHMWRLMSSYGLIITVYSVLNLERLPELMRWLWAPLATALSLSLLFRRHRALLS